MDQLDINNSSTLNSLLINDSTLSRLLITLRNSSLQLSSALTPFKDSHSINYLDRSSYYIQRSSVHEEYLDDHAKSQVLNPSLVKEDCSNVSGSGRINVYGSESSGVGVRLDLVCRWLIDLGSLDSSSFGLAHNSTINAETDWSIMLFVLLIVISAVTTIGNGLVLFVLVRNKSLHSPSNLFIGSLACADLIIGLFVMPVASYYFVLNDNTWNLGLPVCQLWLSLDYFASCSSILNLVAMSLDRYFSIAHALSYRQYRNYKNFLIVIAVIWILSSVYTPPILLWHQVFNNGIRTIPEDKCDVEFATEMEFKFVSLLLSFIVPFCTMCIVYLRIFIVIHQRTKKSSQRQSSMMSSFSKPEASPSNLVTKSPRARLLPKITRDATIYEMDECRPDEASQKKSRAISSPEPATRNSCVKICEGPPTTLVPNNGSFEESGKRSTSMEMGKNGFSKISKVQRRISSNLNMIRRRRSADQQREVKAAKQLAFILLAFAICWLPYMTIYMGYATKAPIFQSEFSITFFTLSVWLGYMNSFLNPILYPLCIDSFKKAFRELFTGKKLPHRGTPHPGAAGRTRRQGQYGPPQPTQRKSNNSGNPTLGNTATPVSILIGAAARAKSRSNASNSNNCAMAISKSNL
ncbi:5-hydroxytryptamine receptor 1D-like isoform X2 [Convolutriloba macropyga]|uniref:5-hydroxytryptamine receptor 1D-like isoform X2 n=1 Tax=Convolutriloba macropyga TaxID=536237 RepID=UPI003F5254DC